MDLDAAQTSPAGKIVANKEADIQFVIELDQAKQRNILGPYVINMV